jgi:hypothetical protein
MAGVEGLFAVRRLNLSRSNIIFYLAFQVLMGDLKPAIENHEVLYQVVKKHNFIPEAFTMDFQVRHG